MTIITTKFPTLPSSLCPCTFHNSTIRTPSRSELPGWWWTATNFHNSLNNPPLKSSIFTHKPIKIQQTHIKISNLYPKPTSKTTSFAHFDQYPDQILDNSSNSSSGHVSLRLSSLVDEFRSLKEPIDRVKRLLEYGSLLPGLGELNRSPEKRVPGCAAQVWVEVGVDEMGRMKYGADSDSEITKGFCSCLIFLLNGAYPQDVLKVKAEDLADMNVGLPVRSRVNSWHNVLISIQERTKKFLVEEDEEVCQLEQSDTFLPLIVPADSNSIVAKGEVCVP